MKNPFDNLYRSQSDIMRDKMRKYFTELCETERIEFKQFYQDVLAYLLNHGNLTLTDFIKLSDEATKRAKE